MIRKIQQSTEDRKKLEALDIDPAIFNDDRVEYAGLVIKKPWGYEYLAFENEYVAVWILYLKHKTQTSLHSHLNKTTSLVVLSGEAVCTTLNAELPLKAGEGLFLEKGVFHSTRSVSPEGVLVMETETPTNKKDLVRLGDTYGRTGRGYEGVENHTSPSESEHGSMVTFHDEQEKYDCEKIIGNCRIIIKRHSDSVQLRKALEDSNFKIAWILKGEIKNPKGERRVEHGDMVNVEELKKILDECMMQEIELLLLRKEA